MSYLSSDLYCLARYPSDMTSMADTLLVTAIVPEASLQQQKMLLVLTLLPSQELYSAAVVRLGCGLLSLSLLTAN